MTDGAGHPGPVLDLRGEPAPSERALERALALAPGAVAVLLMPSGLPVRLLTLLSARGMQVRLDRLRDGLRLNIRRPDIEQMLRLAERPRPV